MHANACVDDVARSASAMSAQHSHLSDAENVPFDIGAPCTVLLRVCGNVFAVSAVR